jgi:hypothetical protein
LVRSLAALKESIAMVKKLNQSNSKKKQKKKQKKKRKLVYQMATVSRIISIAHE